MQAKVNFFVFRMREVPVALQELNLILEYTFNPSLNHGLQEGVYFLS